MTSLWWTGWTMWPISPLLWLSYIHPIAVYQFCYRYVFFFQWPFLAELLMCNTDYDAVGQMFMKGLLNREETEAYKFSLSQPGQWNHHDDVIKWKHFPRHWPFVRGIHRGPALHKGQWRGALVLFLICAWTNGWVNNRDAGDLGRHRAHYDVTVMILLYHHH